MALDAVACGADEELRRSDALTAEQARACLAELEGLPPLLEMRDAIDGYERFLVLDYFQALVRGRSDELEDLVPHSLRNAAIDWNLALRTANETYDSMVSAADRDSHRERQLAFHDIEQRISAEIQNNWPPGKMTAAALLGNRTTISRHVALSPIATLIHTSDTAQTAATRADSRFHLTRFGFALAAYRADQGASPDTLDALVPDDITEMPLDPFTDLPFVYERNDDGYRLYSVGENMLDDGGRTFDTEPRGDDILIEVPCRARPANGTNTAIP